MISFHKFKSSKINYMILCAIFAQVTFFGASLLLFRKYGEAQFAYLGQYMAYSQIAAVFITLRQEIRFIYKSDAEKYEIEQEINIRSIYAIILGVLFILLSHIYNFPISYQVIALSIVSSGIISLNNFYLQKVIGNRDYLSIVIIRNGWIFSFALLAFISNKMSTPSLLYIVYLDLASRALLILYLLRIGANKVDGNLLLHSLNMKNKLNIDILSALISLIVYNLPFILLPYYTSPELIGLAYFCYRIANAPINLFANTLNDFFKAKYKETARSVDLSKQLAIDFKLTIVFSGVIFMAFFVFLYMAQFLFPQEFQAVFLIQLFLLPAFLRLVHSSFIFLPQMKDRLVTNSYLYIRGLLYLCIGTCLSVFFDQNIQYIIPVSYTIFFVDALFYTHSLLEGRI